MRRWASDHATHAYPAAWGETRIRGSIQRVGKWQPEDGSETYSIPCVKWDAEYEQAFQRTVDGQPETITVAGAELSAPQAVVIRVLPLADRSEVRVWCEERPLCGLDVGAPVLRQLLSDMAVTWPEAATTIHHFLRTAPRESLPPDLTVREAQIVRLIRQPHGPTMENIARQVSLSESRLYAIVGELRERLGVGVVPNHHPRPETLKRKKDSRPK